MHRQLVAMVPKHPNDFVIRLESVDVHSKWMEPLKIFRLPFGHRLSMHSLVISMDSDISMWNKKQMITVQSVTGVLLHKKSRNAYM